jgi:hypothetical protein
VKYAANFDSIDTTKKLANGHTNKIFMLVTCSEFFRWNVPLQYPLVNFDENIPSLYTEEIIMGKDRMKKKTKSTMICHLH